MVPKQDVVCTFVNFDRLDFDSSDLDRFDLPSAPRAPLAVALYSAPDLHWVCDSGADVFVVPPGDPCIDTLSDSSTTLQTSAGPVVAQWARLRTPLGVRFGIVSAGSPRLLPTSELDFFSQDRKRRAVKAVYNGIDFNTVWGKIPMISHRAHFGECADFGQVADVRRPRKLHLELSAYGSCGVDVACNGQLSEQGSGGDAHLLDHATKSGDCESCQLGKLQFPGKRRVNPIESSTARLAGEEIVADLCTPWPATVAGERTLLVMHDSATGVLEGAPLLGKLPGAVQAELLQFRDTLRRMAAGSCLEGPWRFKTDPGGEFMSLGLRDWIAGQGGVHVLGVTGRHVGSAERAVKTVAQGVRTLLHAASLPQQFWGFAARCFAFNTNSKNSAWVKVQKEQGKPYEPRVFGSLCYAKLSEEQLRGPRVSHDASTPKAEVPAHPCAFLGYSRRVRKGAHVLFRNRQGKLAVTCVDYRGIVWPSRVRMAFVRKVRDLRVLTVGDEEREMSESDFPQGPGQASVSPPVGGKHTQPVPAWHDSNSKCPACRGRARAHTFASTCRWHGLSAPLLLKLRRLLKGVPRKDPLLEAAARRAVEGASESDLCNFLNAQLHNSTSDTNSSARQQRQERRRGRRVEARIAATGLSGDAGLKKPPSEDIPTAATGLSDDAGLKKPPSVGIPNAQVRTVAEPSRLPTEPRSAVELNKLPASSQVDDPAAFSIFSSACLGFPEHPDERGLLCVTGPHAWVTRKLNKSERESPEGQRAIATEMERMVKHSVFGRPVSRRDVTDPGATLSGFVMLTFAKHAELGPLRRKFKGRAVVLGNRVVKVKSDAAVHCEFSPFWESLHSELSSLDESRVVDAYATMFGYRMESVDLESAYLQCEWPADKSTHYLQIPKELWRFLPVELQPDSSVVFPVWPMRKACYGHPASGHLWVNKLLSWLQEKNWTPVGRAGNRALLKRGKTLLAVYVDDVKAAGPDSELRSLWAEAAQSFVFGGEGACLCSEFLGQQYTRGESEHHHFTRVSMECYIDSIIGDYESEWHTCVRPSSVPLVNNLRKKRPEDTCTPVRRVQCVVGQLLWVMRCCRPDLALACSALGSRVNSWTQACETELARTVGFLKHTRDVCLEFRWPKGEVEFSCELHSDADWSLPKSQSGFFACVVGDNGGLLPLHWASKKQPVTADAVSAAEIVASHLALKDGGQSMCVFLRSVQPDSRFSKERESDWTLRLDNNTAIKNIVDSPTDTVEFMLKAIGARHGFLRDLHAAGVFLVSHVRSVSNRANLATKAVTGRGEFERESVLLGLRPIEGPRALRAAVWRAFNSFVRTKRGGE